MAFDPERETNFLSDHKDRASAAMVLGALAHTVRLEVVTRLLEKPARQNELGKSLGVGVGALSRHMSLLEEIGLVTRDSSHSPYSLTAPQETLTLLRAAAELSLAVAEVQLDDAKARQQRLANLGNAQ